MTSPDEQGQQAQESAGILGQLARKYGVEPYEDTVAPPFSPATGEPTEGQPDDGYSGPPRRTISVGSGGGVPGSWPGSTATPARSIEELARDWPALRGRVTPGNG